MPRRRLASFSAPGLDRSSNRLGGGRRAASLIASGGSIGLRSVGRFLGESTSSLATSSSATTSALLEAHAAAERREPPDRVRQCPSALPNGHGRPAMFSALRQPLEISEGRTAGFCQQRPFEERVCRRCFPALLGRLVLRQALAVLRERARVAWRLDDVPAEEPAEESVVSELIGKVPLAANRVERNQQSAVEKALGCNRAAPRRLPISSNSDAMRRRASSAIAFTGRKGWPAGTMLSSEVRHSIDVWVSFTPRMAPS